MKLKMDNSYKAQKIIRKGEKTTVILAEPQVLNNGTMWLKIWNTVTGSIVYTLRLLAR